MGLGKEKNGGKSGDDDTGELKWSTRLHVLRNLSYAPELRKNEKKFCIV